jgi:membrane-associated phospholipid phosphatase
MRCPPSGHPRRRLVVVALGALAVMGCLVLLLAIADDVREQEAIWLDAVATPFLHALANPTLDALMYGITQLGSTPLVAVIGAMALAVLFRSGYRRHGLFLITAVCGSVVLSETLKILIHRPRPQLAWATAPAEYSFPSSHSMNSLVFYLALALVWLSIRGRGPGILAIVVAVSLAMLVGISRIYLGYHYLSDVVAGWLAGFLWVLTVAAAFRLPRHAGPSVPGGRDDALEHRASDLTW